MAIKPGKSDASAGVFPNFSDNAHVVLNVSSEVAIPRMTSTSFITGTGFIKCMPMTLSGRPVWAAIRPMGMEDVLVARITSGRQVASRSLKIWYFIGSFSVAASTTKSAGAISPRSTLVLIRPRTAFISSSVILPFSTPRFRILLMLATPFSTNSVFISFMIT